MQPPFPSLISAPARVCCWERLKHHIYCTYGLIRRRERAGQGNQTKQMACSEIVHYGLCWSSVGRFAKARNKPKSLAHCIGHGVWARGKMETGTELDGDETRAKEELAILKTLKPTPTWEAEARQEHWQSHTIDRTDPIHVGTNPGLGDCAQTERATETAGKLAGSPGRQLEQDGWEGGASSPVSRRRDALRPRLPRPWR